MKVRRLGSFMVINSLHFFLFNHRDRLSSENSNINEKAGLINILIFSGMKSLVNWPSNNNQKIPDYEKSEIDVFKVITDYFTKTSSPLATFFLYTLLQETFIRAEAADLEFRKSTNQILQPNTETACSTQPSALAGISQRTVSTPLIHSFPQNRKQFM